MTAYATTQQFYEHGIPAGVVVQRRRQITSVDTTNDRLTVANHGLVEDQPVKFVADPSASLPAPLVAGTTYYAKPVSGIGSQFQVAATPGGAAIDLTDSGTQPFGIAVDADALITASLAFTAREIDDACPAHEVPFTAPYPDWVIRMNAVLAADDVVNNKLGRNHRGIRRAADEARAELAMRREKSLPVRDTKATASASLTQRWSDADRGWDLGSGRIM